MTFTYNEDLLSSDLNRIRLELGDTNSDRPLLKDEEIDQIVSEESGFHFQVAACARLICSFFSNGPMKYRIEGYSEDQSKSYVNFEKIAQLHEAAGGSGPWVGSIFKGWKETIETDDSLVKPSFKKGMFDYPGT